MRSKNKLKTCVIIFLMIAPLSADQSGHRTIETVADKTIAERLLPDDEVVTVHRDYNDRVTVPAPDGVSTVEELLVTGFGTALVVDVTRVHGILVLDGRWIRTRFEADIVEVLASGKNVTPGVVPAKGRSIVFSGDGGEITIGKVLVKTFRNISFPAHERYLVFLGDLIDGGDHQMLGTDPVIVRGDKLVAVPGSNTVLESVTLNAVRQMARGRKR
jgi:hypothetical protein